MNEYLPYQGGYSVIQNCDILYTLQSKGFEFELEHDYITDSINEEENLYTMWIVNSKTYNLLS